MTEKKIYRTCVNCGEEKRTTIHPHEEEEYLCGECCRSIAKTALDKSSVGKGTKIAVILVVISLIVGYLIGKFIF